MSFFYNIFIYLYKSLLWISSLINSKHRDLIEGQKDLLEKIKIATRNEKNIVWFHVSSLGEFEQSKPLISEYKNKYLSHKILITIYSPSAYNIIKDNSIADWIFYLPHDTNRNAKKFVNAVNPIKVIFIKYEFWYNYISEISKNNIPLYYVCSIFRKDQYFFKFYGKWFSKQLNKVTLFFVQDQNSKNLLRDIGINQVKISGDTRFETVQNHANEEYKNIQVEEFIHNGKILIAGSTSRKDEQLICKLINKLDYKFIIVPHETNNINHLRKIKNSIFLSESKEKSITDFDVLIIDNIGMLSKLYRYANIIYIGGGFDKGIHNILEAAVYNTPIIFGPNYYKSKEAKELLELGAVKSISDYYELENAINYFKTKDVTSTIKEYFESNIGSVKSIIKSI